MSEQEARTRITALLLDVGAGAEGAMDALVPLVYDELRRIAGSQLRREAVGHTLSPTGLVHEAWLRLVDQDRVQWANRAQFYAVAARVMRRVLVDHARKVRSAKRGGGWKRMDLDDSDIAVDEQAAEVLALDDALARLAELNPRLAQVVESRFFGGMTEEETASALGVTDRTVRRDWLKAKGWLREAVDG